MDPSQPERRYGFQNPPPRKTFPIALFLVVASIFFLIVVPIARAFLSGSPDPPAAAAAPAAVTRPPSPSPSPTVKLIKLPNVVGRNHQEAQDFLQSKGIVHLREHDATGQGRLLIWDRNWVVVSQKPAPGTMVNPETVRVMLNSRKIAD